MSLLCCYAGRAAAEVKCHSPKDEFSSCFDLMRIRGVQVCVWILGLTSLIGNLFVILMRAVVKEDNGTLFPCDKPGDVGSTDGNLPVDYCNQRHAVARGTFPT